MNKPVLCLLSGGVDSFVLIDFLQKNHYDVSCLYVNYGQISAKLEYEAFLKICKFKNISWYHKIDVNNFGKNLNTGLTKSEIQDSFFPSRNLLLITLASSFLDLLNCDYIAIGVIRSSYEYPDCKRTFFNDLESLISISVKREIRILTPIDNFTKIDIIKYLQKYQLPIDLSFSCEKGVEDHCRQCPSCLERFDAIKWLKKKIMYRKSI